ncbi:hypothetical protein ACLBOM_14850 [Escherichia coli]
MREAAHVIPVFAAIIIVTAAAFHQQMLKHRYANTEVKVTHSTLNKRYDEEIANNTTRSHAWKCSKSTAVLKAGSNAGDTTPVP